MNWVHTSVQCGLLLLTAGVLSAQEKAEISVWRNNYDFVAGDKIMFYDDLRDEEVGEFPSKWNVASGGAEVVMADSEKVIKVFGKIFPLFKGNTELPAQFTLEFDIYLQKPVDGQYSYYVLFNGKNTTEASSFLLIEKGWMRLSTSAGRFEGRVPDKKPEEFYNSWHHISIAFNERSFKAYFNEHRLISIPVLDPPIRRFYLNVCCNETNKHSYYVKNVRLAEGGKPLYKQQFSEGKIVTNAIYFEVNRSTIVPRSYAEINRIAGIMKENADARFRIDGYTDGDGDEAYNLKLSQDRAGAVKQALTQLGIDASRLEVKGMGEANPVAGNDTPEGRAQNRRVEFVKL
jgi:outer membrane protein OmpA-like peptidoglycan-associated protein